MNPIFISLLKDIKKKHFLPFYLLHGDEPFFIEQIANEIENTALPVDQRSFNQNIFFGKDLSVGALMGNARSFPMMGDKQVLIIKEAQDIAGLENKDNAKLMEAYFLNPQPSTILVICHNEPLDERKAWVKAAEKSGALFKSKKFYDDKLPDWISDYCHAQKIKISHKAIQLLIDFIGNDLIRMASEIDKITLNLKLEEEISAITIERFVGLSKEFNVFEFQKAIVQRDVLKANHIAIYFAKNQKSNPLIATILNLYSFFSKLLIVHASKDKSDKGLAPLLGVHPYFVREYLVAARNYSLAKNFEIITYIKTAEMRSKGIEAGSLSEKNILQDLVFNILH
jgi:DNA polymerase III subunit delta